ncbi:alpha/beta fold hydrolase [Frondihabitans australicus]|uniref:Pimeloyl-ACP methyl ester carboxylesterase n=1 Tax=Frondihabitans australicus TaxID=386892 RepID=A0A495IIL1_9MICO|nr:alpha/beta hydrolase [Frondihabitans australicus]RKR75609.1 pimeloyl-ACP methyl ester carboxylesterase [Frondihabitans australicus]
MTETTRTVQLPAFNVEIPFDDSGSGPAVLVLHGGGGPATVQSIGAHLNGTHRILLPTHPGWNGTTRPDGLTTVADLAAVYLRLLADLELTDVLVIGSSMGGWVAAEMALQSAARSQAGAQEPTGRVGAIALIDAAGILPDGYEFADITGLSPRAFAELNWHDADRFFVDPATLPEAQVAAQRANVAAMLAISGEPYMHDPTLLGRLGALTIPALTVWGDSDGSFTPDYGRAYAAAIPGARFELIADAGHLPHLEQPAATFAVLDSFVAGP